MIMFRFLAAFRLPTQNGFRGLIKLLLYSVDHLLWYRSRKAFSVAYVSVSSSFSIAYTGRFMRFRVLGFNWRSLGFGGSGNIISTWVTVYIINCVLLMSIVHVLEEHHSSFENIWTRICHLWQGFRYLAAADTGFFTDPRFLGCGGLGYTDLSFVSDCKDYQLFALMSIVQLTRRIFHWFWFLASFWMLLTRESGFSFVLQLRNVIDPKQHFKKNDTKGVPKFFQVQKSHVFASVHHFLIFK